MGKLDMEDMSGGTFHTESSGGNTDKRSIAAAIISGVIGTAGLISSSVAAKKKKEAEEKALEEGRDFTAGESKKDRRLTERKQDLEGLGVLAGQRIDAQNMATKRSFNRDAIAGMKLAMQRKRKNKRSQPAPGIAPQGMGTTTFGRA